MNKWERKEWTTRKGEEEYAKLKLEEQETIIYLKNNTDKPIEIPFPLKIEHKKESKT